MKMKKMRKGVAAILAIALLITLTPVMALTDDEPDTETLLTNAECVVSSETANTQAAVTNWIKANWLPGISGLDDVLERDYGVEISDLKMTTPTDPFKAAENGTVESPEGSAGQFKFSVVVPGADGVGTPQLTVSKTCTITPKKYIPKIRVKSTVLPSATAGVSYSLSLDGLLADGFSADLVSWTLPSTTLLPEGLTFSAEDGKISGTPTTAGTYTLSDIQAAATGGQYQSSVFTFTLVVNAADQYPTPVISASGETVDFKDGVVHVDKEKTVTLLSNLPANAPNHTLQWQVEHEGKIAKLPTIGATQTSYSFLDESYLNNSQIRCVATYSGSQVRESAPVKIIYRIAETAAVTGTVTTENGTPVAGWNVLATDKNNNTIAEAVTGKDGEYRFEALQANENYNLSIQGVTGNNSTPVTTGNPGSQQSKNITAATTNIPGATSKNVPISGGENAKIEFVPIENPGGGSTIAVNPYTPTTSDISFGATAAYPESEVNTAEEVEVDDISIFNKQLSIEDNGTLITRSKIGQIIWVKNDQFVVQDIQETKLIFIHLNGDGAIYEFDNNANLVKTNEFAKVEKEDTIVYINGTPYTRLYKIDNNYFIYLLGGWVNPAGIYNDDGKAIFNQDCEPDSEAVQLHIQSYQQRQKQLQQQQDQQQREQQQQQQQDQQQQEQDPQQQRQQQIADFFASVITKNGKTYYMSNTLSYDINVLWDRARSNGAIGTIGISGIDNANNSISVHLSSSGYDKGRMNQNGDGFFWPVLDTSPFMIFTFTEANTEIPVTVIDTESYQKKVSPKTSDNMNMAVWGLLALGSGTFITRTYIKRRKYDR